MTPPGRPTSKPHPPASEANASDVFVAPVFHRWASPDGVLADGTTCPPSLLPFVKSFDFTVLATALQERPLLYFHPAVREQIKWLLHLRYDEELWDRVGWEVHVEVGLGIADPPEVKRVDQILQQLMGAHVSALFPDMMIAPKPAAREQPGPRGGRENPHPTSGNGWISAEMLYATWRRLRTGFKSPEAKTLLRAISAQLSPDDVGLVVALAHDVVALAHDPANDEPPIWSALLQRVSIGEPPPGLSDDDRQFWLDYQQPFRLRTTVDLERVVREAISDLRQRVPRLRVSRAGYLASAVLAAHLGDATPERVQYAVDNYRRAHGV